MSYCSGTQIYDKGLGIGFRVRQVTTRVLSVCIRTNIRVRGVLYGYDDAIVQRLDSNITLLKRMHRISAARLVYGTRIL